MTNKVETPKGEDPSPEKVKEVEKETDKSKTFKRKGHEVKK